MVKVLGCARNGGERVRNKKCLCYVTIAAILVLASVFVGVHTVGVKDSFAHTQLLTGQQQSRRYSQFMPGRDGGKIQRTIEISRGKTIPKDRQKFGSLSTVLSDSGLLSSFSPRGPPAS